MKPVQGCRLSLLFFLILCSRALSQTVYDGGNDGSNSVSSVAWEEEKLFLLQLISPSPAGAYAQASDQAPRTSEKPDDRPYGWNTAFYPALAWVPEFEASFTLPPLNTPGPSGSTDSSLNGAYFGGARFERGKWSANLVFMWAALSAQRETPFAKVNLDFVFGDVIAGREVLRNVYLEGGIRRLASDIHAIVGSSSAIRSPGFWDPLVGVTYRRQLGRKWRILIHGDGGGFGVGTDVDVTASARAEWQFVRHFGIAMGYGGMHFSVRSSEAGRALTISPTMHGPIFGLGVFF